jgi:hypothetical protein
VTGLDRVVAGPRNRFRNSQLRLRRQVVVSDRPALLFLIVLTIGIVALGLLDGDLFPRPRSCCPSSWPACGSVHAPCPGS